MSTNLDKNCFESAGVGSFQVPCGKAVSRLPKRRDDALIATDIPRHRQRQPFTNALGGRVAQQALCFADVGQAVAHVAGAEVAVDGGRRHGLRVVARNDEPRQVVAQEVEELV